MIERVLVIGIGSLVLTWVVLVAMLWLRQRQLIYYPMAQVPAVHTALRGGQEVSFETDDGLWLAGWYVPPPGGRGGPTVLVCNGNGGNRAFRVPLAEQLVRAGFGVLLFDYRGYGGNPGQPSEEGLRRDARAARNYLVSRPEVDPRRLVYLGESLGSAVATALAVEQPPAVLVLRSPFSSLVDVAQLHYPWVPVGPLLLDRYPVADLMPRVQAPVLVVAGGRDALVPAALSRRVYEQAHEPKRFVLMPDADHNDPRLADGDQLIQEITRFAAETAGAGG